MRDPLRAIARHLAQVGASTSVGARWEDNPRNIAKHYLKTWFALDLISYAAITPRRRPAPFTRAAHSRPGPSLPAQYPTIRRALDRYRRGDGPAEGRPPLTPDAADQADSTRARISHVQAMGDAHGNRLWCERRTRLHIYTPLASTSTRPATTAAQPRLHRHTRAREMRGARVRGRPLVRVRVGHPGWLRRLAASDLVPASISTITFPAEQPHHRHHRHHPGWASSTTAGLQRTTKAGRARLPGISTRPRCTSR